MRTLKKIPVIVISTILLMSYITQVNAMGFLDFMKVYIFSEVDGIVLMEGKPVAGAKVVRTADYKDKVHTDTVVTDESGRFHFDDISNFSMRLSETVIYQEININYENKDYLAWKLTKRHENRYGELTDPEKPEEPIKKVNLKCELTDDPKNEQRVEFILGDRIIYGLGKWN